MSDYILDARTYLPDFLQESKIMNEVMDCLNVLISTKQPTFESIQQAYYDTLYKTKDYSKLSYEAKIEVMKELGFDYLLDILILTSDQLTQLLIFFNLIYILKGKKEGLKICLDTLGMIYTYVTWDETEPEGQPFTAKLKIVGNDYAATEVFRKIKNFIRSYMLPWIDITIELIFDAPPIYIYPSAGLLTKMKYTKYFSATRDVVNVAVYNKSNYDDKDSYGVAINTGEDQDNPQAMPKYNFKIIPTPSDATVIIDGVERNEAQIEQGKLFFYKVYQDNNVYKPKEGMMVLNQDKELEIKLKLI